MWGSRTSQARTPDRRYRRIWTCLSGEVGTSAGQAPDVRYPERGNEGFPSGCMRDSRSGGMRDSRPGGMSYDSRPGGMSDATCRKGPSTCPRKRESRGTFLGRIPQVGGFSTDHHLGSGWLCKQFRAVMNGCITTKGKTVR